MVLKLKKEKFIRYHLVKLSELRGEECENNTKKRDS